MKALMQMDYTTNGRAILGEEAERSEEPQEDGHDDEKVEEEHTGGEGGGGAAHVHVQPAVQLRRGRRSSSSGRLVTVRNTAEVVRTRRLSVEMVHRLPSNEKVELIYFTRTGQPIKDAGCLFNHFCISIGNQTRRFPIDPLDWRLVPGSLKLAAWEAVKARFWVTEDLKKYAIAKIGDAWKEQRNKFFNDRYRGGEKTKEEIQADVPDGVDPAEWRRYVDWRYGEVGKARSQRGAAARACQDVHHTGGSRPFAVLYDEMKEDAAAKGVETNVYRDFLLQVYSRSDGTPVTQRAAEAITQITKAAERAAERLAAERASAEAQDESVDPLDEVVVLREELGTRDHSGRVRGLGFGATPSQLARPSQFAGRSTYNHGGESGSRQSAPLGAQVLEERLQEQRRAMVEQERRLADQQRAIEEQECRLAERERAMTEREARIRAEAEAMQLRAEQSQSAAADLLAEVRRERERERERRRRRRQGLSSSSSSDD